MSEINRKGYFRVIGSPMEGSGGEDRGIKRISVYAFNSRHAVAIACQKLDLHPKNWVFSTDRLTGNEDSHECTNKGE
jgi:hypothetical protein